MNLAEVKDCIYDIVADFFQGASVIWAEQVNTTTKLPYITLKVANEQVNENVIYDLSNSHRYYQSRVNVDINLYTKGKPVNVQAGSINNYENTAVSDMADFLMYLNSDYGLIVQDLKEVSIGIEGNIIDVSSLENDNQYRFRSMAQMTVKFLKEASGPYGVRNISDVPSYSGGATEDMVKAEDEIIETITVEEESND